MVVVSPNPHFFYYEKKNIKLVLFQDIRKIYKKKRIRQYCVSKRKRNMVLQNIITNYVFTKESHGALYRPGDNKNNKPCSINGYYY